MKIKINKIKKPLILVGSLIVVLIIGLAINKSSANPNIGYLKNQVIDGLSIENAEINYVNGITTFIAEVHNENESEYELAYISINLEDDNNNKTELIGYIGEALQPGEYRKITASIDKDLTNSTSINYTIEKEFFKNSYKLVKASGNTGEYAEIGDTIKILVNKKIENFYVISNDNHKVSALAYYNLNVGDNQYKENGVVVNAGIQDEHVVGNKTGMTKYGNVAFSDNKPSYTIADNIEKTYTGPIHTALYDETTGYQKYIRQAIPEATVRLIKKSELEALGCDYDDRKCNIDTVINKHREWIYSTSYWTGSSDMYGDPYVIRSFGGFVGDDYAYSNWSGVRPVVEFHESLD